MDTGCAGVMVIKANDMKTFILCVSIAFFASVQVGYTQFRVVGYIHNWGRSPELSKIDFNKITHLNIAFVNPDSSGNLIIPYGFDALIKAAKKNNVKVLASIGGGSDNPYYHRLLGDSLREEFLEKIVRLSIDFKLDGIDMDLENNAIDENYGEVIAYLSRRMRASGKLLTAALATWNAEKVGDSTLKEFTFINVMSYDQTGPWRPDRPGAHSTYEKAAEDLRYWTETRKLPKSKLNLGLPFYGYAFGYSQGESFGYKDIVSSFQDSQITDSLHPSTGGAIYYNGIPTIKKKVALARKKAGGVMIWQLLQDAPGEHSLLKVVDAARRE